MYAPIDLNLVRAFVGVHETGSFSAAAHRLRVPRSTVSRAVSTLEEEAGVLLFHRTTRRVTTTAAGVSLFDRVAPSLAALEESLAQLPEALEAPSGRVRLTTSADLGTTVVADAIARFATRYPAAQVDVHLSSAVVDLVREGFDLALRFARGRLKDSSLVARKLASVDIRLYASPSYLSRRGTPSTEADLAEHDLVTLPGAPSFDGARGSPRSTPPRARTTCNDKGFARELLRAGGGIGLLPSYLAAADVTEGSLVRVLPRWALPSGALYLLQPSRKVASRGVTAFRDLLLELFRRRPLDA